MKKIILLTMGILTFSTGIYAQESMIDDISPQVHMETPYETQPDPGAVYSEDVYQSDVVQEQIYEPAPAVVDYSPDVFGGRTNPMPGSFSQNIAWDLRNNFGFSLGAYEGYYFNHNSGENPLSDSTGRQSSSATMLSANVFTNYARGKSAMHLDYSTGHSFFPGRRNSIKDLNHNVNASYTYRINDRARFHVQDYFSVYSNDPFGDIFSINSSFGRILSESSYFDIIFAPRRYTRNTVTGMFSSDVTGKGTNLRLFGSYDNFWHEKLTFGTDSLGDSYSAKVGAGISQRITSWLSLGSSYSIQLNDDLRDSQTHRVEIGRFQFVLSPNIEVYASGGIEITDEGGHYRTREMAHAGITYTTEINSLYANYSRSMMSVSGFRRQLPSDTVMIGLGQPIGSRLNARLMGHYQRSSSFFNESGLLVSYQGQASMEYVIVPGLFASVSYTYRRQKNSINSMNGIPYVERSTIHGGLQYSWPSGRSGY